MTRFSDLARPLPGELPGDTQKRASGEFGSALTGSSFVEWSPDVIHSAETVLVIGTAVWSHCDLRLLDFLDENVSNVTTDVVVVVFDIDESITSVELERRVPGQAKAHGPPVVGLWKRGRFVESACGYAGRPLIYRVLGLDPTQADGFVIHARTPAIA